MQNAVSTSEGGGPKKTLGVALVTIQFDRKAKIMFNFMVLLI